MSISHTSIYARINIKYSNSNVVSLSIILMLSLMTCSSAVLLAVLLAVQSHVLLSVLLVSTNIVLCAAMCFAF